MGSYKDMLCRARETEREMWEDYRLLHKIAEIGLQLPKTTAFCREKLENMGYEAEESAGGLIATVGGGERCVLLRADMDALPIREESGLRFAAGNGCMHACGHDMHTAMLLGAARLLRECEGELSGVVKLCFQPGEETLEGAKRMIEEGLLEDPMPEAAAMIHVLTGTEYKTGTVIIPPAGVGAAGADFFRVTVSGEGCHGSTPHLGRDPLTAAAHIIVALSGITAREVPAGGGEVLTVGKISAGDAANAIPDSSCFSGTLRSYGEETREFLKERLVSVCEHTAKAFRCDAAVEFTSGCPSFLNDRGLTTACKELFKDAVIVPEGTRGGGSEDFSYVSRKVPSVMLALAAGERSAGYTEPLHSPKARFDEGALPYGAAALASFALQIMQ